MLAVIVLLVFGVLLAAAWRRFDLSTCSFRRVIRVAAVAGIGLTVGLHLAFWLQPPTNPARWLVILSDVLLLFPLVAVVGTDLRLLQLLGPVLMALEVSLLLLVIMMAARALLRGLDHDSHV